MADSHGAPSGASLDEAFRPEIDVKAMPNIIRRIVVMAFKVDPVQVALAMGCSLGAAVAGLTVPRLFGAAINQIQALLNVVLHARLAHEAAAQQVLLQSRSMHALWTFAGLMIVMTTVQGILTGVGGYNAERVSQKVAYVLRLDYFRQLQRLPFGFHD